MFFLFFYGYKLTITETEKRYKKKARRNYRHVQRDIIMELI